MVQLISLIIVEQVKCCPKHLHDVACASVVLNGKVTLDKDQGMEHVVSNPLELVCLKAHLVFVP